MSFTGLLNGHLELQILSSSVENIFHLSVSLSLCYLYLTAAFFNLGFFNIYIISVSS